MSTLRIGAFIDPMSVEDSAQRAGFLEKNGFHSAWLSDETLVFNSPPDLVVPDVFAALTAVAARTKKIRIGTGVLDASIRHPVKTAQSIASVDSFSGGRLLAGIGGGEVGNHETFGIPFDHPYGRLEEVVKIIKGISPATQTDPFSFHGRFYDMDAAYLKIKPTTRPHPPLIISAFGPRALDLAGSQGDGWLTFSHTPESYSKVLRGPVAGAAARAGRSVADLETVCVLPLALCREDDATSRKNIAGIAKDWLVWSPDNMKLLVPDIQAARKRQPYAKSNSAAAINELAQLSKLIPEEVALETVAYGDARQCTERLAAFMRAGCKHVILYFVAAAPSWKATVEAFAKDVLPHFD